MASLDSPREVGGFNKLRTKSGRVSPQMDQKKGSQFDSCEPEANNGNCRK
jgi:hypothetical protein